jgi:tRNA G18 (ribose-2'-O)-methylase SpoU
MRIVAVLDSLRSVYNVGSIFRTSNAVGVQKVFLCGTTPTPLDKKGLPRKDFAKVALGAEHTLAWEYKEGIQDTVRELLDDGYYIIAVEQWKSSIDYKSIDVRGKEKVAFIIGNEVDGIANEILSKASVVAEIPMLGTKESLNVTIAFGIAVYRILGV